MQTAPAGNEHHSLERRPHHCAKADDRAKDAPHLSRSEAWSATGSATRLPSSSETSGRRGDLGPNRERAHCERPHEP